MKNKVVMNNIWLIVVLGNNFCLLFFIFLIKGSFEKSEGGFLNCFGEILWLDRKDYVL